MTEDNVVALDRAASRSIAERPGAVRDLHTPTQVCRGCCSTGCAGQCDWADEYDGELLTVCSHCCIDPDDHKQDEPCLDRHNHGAEHGASRQICATNALLDVQPPPAVATRQAPRVARRTTLRPI